MDFSASKNRQIFIYFFFFYGFDFLYLKEMFQRGNFDKSERKIEIHSLLLIVVPRFVALLTLG